MKPPLFSPAEKLTEKRLTKIGNLWLCNNRLNNQYLESTKAIAFPHAETH